MSILRLLMSMYLAILAKAWSFLFALYFASKNQLPGFYVIGTLVESGLVWILKSLTLSSFLMEQFETWILKVPFRAHD